MQTAKEKKVLIISAAFPPSNVAGTHRIGKLAKYLKHFGWEPFVLTVDRIKGSEPTFPLEIDESRVTRTRYFDLTTSLRRSLVGANYFEAVAAKDRDFRLFIFKIITSIWRCPPLSILRTLLTALGWYIFAVGKGIDIIRKQKIDLIFCSGQPFSAYFIASRLQQKTKIPWVADFRDLWTVSPYAERPAHPWEIKLEKLVMRSSSLLVTVSQPLADILCAIHSKEVMVVPNGFDEDDYDDGVPLTSKFTISNVGFIFPEDDFSPLFDAVSQLKQEGRITADNFELRFFSNELNIPQLASRYGIADLVNWYGWVPFAESTMRQQESTALMLARFASGAYSSKIFTYIGARRPILAITPKGSIIEELLNECGCGVSLQTAEEIKGLLSRWIEEFRNSKQITYHYNPRDDVIRKYSRREQAKTLARAFDHVLQSH